MNTNDAFGMDETGSNPIGNSSSDISNPLTSSVQVWSELTLNQMNAWFDTINTITGSARKNFYNPFFDVSDRANESITRLNDRRVIILCNKPAKVQLHWKDGIPDTDLEVIGPFPLVEPDSRQKQKQKQNSEWTINIRYASSEDTQVIDIVVPKDLSNGRYAGPIFSTDGKDHGYLSVGLG